MLDNSMIEYTELASIAITTLVPYLTKGGDAISAEVGKNLYSWIKEKLSLKNRQKDLEALNNKPEDPRVQGRLEVALEEILKENRVLVIELTKLVNAAKGETGNTVIGTNINTGTITAGGSVIFGNNNTK